MQDSISPVTTAPSVADKPRFTSALAEPDGFAVALEGCLGNPLSAAGSDALAVPPSMAPAQPATPQDDAIPDLYGIARPPVDPGTTVEVTGEQKSDSERPLLEALPQEISQWPDPVGVIVFPPPIVSANLAPIDTQNAGVVAGGSLEGAANAALRAGASNQSVEPAEASHASSAGVLLAGQPTTDEEQSAGSLLDFSANSALVPIGPSATPQPTPLATEARAGAVSPTVVPLPSPPTTPMLQVVQNVANVATAPRSDAPAILTIQLAPAELGRVQIRIERTLDGQASISLLAERPATLQLLQQDQPELHRALDLAGIPVEGRAVQFQLAPDLPALRDSPSPFGAADAGSGFGSSQGGQAGHRSPGRHGGYRLPDDSSPAPLQNRHRFSGLDITT